MSISQAFQARVRPYEYALEDWLREFHAIARLKSKGPTFKRGEVFRGDTIANRLAPQKARFEVLFGHHHVGQTSLCEL